MANRTTRRFGSDSRSPPADTVLPSIERDVASPDRSSEASTTPEDASIILTPPSSASPHTSQSPALRALAVGSSSSATRRIGRELQRMVLADRSGLENLNDLADAIDGVGRRSESRGTSLAPDDALPSGQSTPRRAPRGRRSLSQTALRRHEVQDEELPQDAFHSASFQRAFRDAKKLMEDTHTELGRSSIHRDPDSTMRRLRDEAGELAGFMYPSTRTVGFVGDSGVGKSSLINSLLDCNQLAGTSNDGRACTCVVTEYHYHASNTYDVEVECFSVEQMNEQISDMLDDYRAFHLHRDEIHSSDMNNCEESAERARDTFRAMFQGRLRSERYLLAQPKSQVLSELREWAADARPSGIGSRRSTNSVNECSAYLKGLASESRSRDVSPKWPFIKKVRVFLNAHILSKGLVLVDLPGLRDLNSARRSITERFLLECHEIFVICNIIRAVTDEGVQCVFRLAQAAHLSNVGIVCTRSDDIQADEARRDWEGERSRRIQDLQDLIEAGRQDQLENDADIAEEYENEPEDRDTEYLNTLYADNSRLSRQISDHKFQLHTYLVTTRNSNVTRELRAQYTVPDSDEPVKVFCVSNKDYWENRAKAREIALPHLQLSGILQLRKHCISIVANSQRRAVTRYMQDSIPALLAQIELWVRSAGGTADLERKDIIRRNLQGLKDRLEEDLNHRRSSFKTLAKDLKGDFNTQIYRGRNVSAWTEAAVIESYDWAGWHHSTYAAFCRNRGEHSTATAGYRNWNAEVVAKMAADLDGPWGSLRSSIQRRQDLAEMKLDELTDWTIEHLEDGLSDMPEIIGPLVNAFVSQKDALLGDIELSHEAFNSNLKILRTDAMSGLRTSLIAEGLSGAYRSCASESGTGSHGRRKAIMNRKLSDEDLFEDLMSSFREGFRILADGIQEGIDAATTSFLESVNSTLEIILSDNVALESEQDPAFRRLVEEAVRKGNREIERIKSVIASQ